MFKGFKTLLTGIVAGTVVGILFAPKKGKEFRKELKKEIDKGGFGIDTIKETVTEMGKDMGESGEKAYAGVNKNKSFKKAKVVAQDLINENIPSHARKNVKKKLSQAKTFLKKLKTKAKKS